MPRQSQRLRIIGGEHRGRLLDFIPQEGLRPTPDRVREALFNWLQPIIVGAHCLDLFSGSGALGFEAASRGAARVTMIDTHPATVRQLENNIALLKLSQVTAQQTDALNWLQHTRERYDIIFLDPPFGKQHLPDVMSLILSGGFLKSGGRLYVESEQAIENQSSTAGWSILKSKSAGQVFYHLLEPAA